MLKKPYNATILTTTVLGLTLTGVTGVAAQAAPSTPSAASNSSAATSPDHKPINPAPEQAQGLIDGGATGVQVRAESASESYLLRLGTADGKRARLTGDEHFRAGSVTKLVTSTAVLRLAEQGKINLDAPVETYLPGKLTFGKQVTVRQLLNQTSGLPENAYEMQLPFDPKQANTLQGMNAFLEQRVTDRQVLGYINNTGLKKAPGSTWQYSNANYVILGQVITAVTRQPYQRYIDKTIFRPLGMRDTQLPVSNTRLPRPAAIGFQPAAFYGGQPGDPRIDLSRQHGSFFGAAGSMITTSDDLTTFLQAVFGGKLLSEKSLQQMYQSAGSGNVVNYGLGVIQHDTPCGVIRGHNGSVYGYQTSAFYLNGTSVVASVTEGTNPYASLQPAQNKMALSVLCPAAGETPEGTRQQFSPR